MQQNDTNMDITLYNTLTRKKEIFTPLKEGRVGVYSCGPTVYHYPHLGNMRAYVFADILNRTLKTKYEDVKHVINITDVGHMVGDGDNGEDKLEKGAKRDNKSVWEVADFYTEAFFADLESLNIDEPYINKKNKNKVKDKKTNIEKSSIKSDKFIFTKATDYIPEQIALIQSLEQSGHTYKTSDGIYFDTSTFPRYADFAKIDVKNLNAGERVEMGEKRNATDFALWKFSPTDEKRQMEWESPWGIGFPGWHIECSAMSEAVLGKHFDIHTGGVDHIPVHHTNEIAQSECAHRDDGVDRKYVRYWMNVNFLQDKTGKMSKSNDDFLRVQSIIDKGINPIAYRYLLLSSNYRSELAFSWESLEAAASAFSKLNKFMTKSLDDNENIKDAINGRYNEEYYEKFLTAIYDDLNTSAGLAIVWEMINAKAPHTYTTILKMNEILGLRFVPEEDKAIELDPETQAKVDELLAKRKEARATKDWTTADTLRTEIQSYGVEVVD